jgi:hypothetical protein
MVELFSHFNNISIFVTSLGKVLSPKITGEARAQQWDVHQSTVVTLFITVSHCFIKKILISVAAYLALPVPEIAPIRVIF